MLELEHYYLVMTIDDELDSMFDVHPCPQSALSLSLERLAARSTEDDIAEGNIDIWLAIKILTKSLDFLLK